MATPAISNDADAQVQCNPICTYGCSAFTGASIAYGMAWLFTAIDPVVAAGFGATNALVGPVIDSATDRVLGDQQSSIASVIKFAVSFFTSTAISVSIASALGFAITVESALTLGVITLVVSAALPCLALGACCCLGAVGVGTAVVGATALSDERRA